MDTAIDDEAAGEECCVAAARAENLGVQRDFEGTRDVETIDGMAQAELLQPREDASRPRSTMSLCQQD